MYNYRTFTAFAYLKQRLRPLCNKIKIKNNKNILTKLNNFMIGVYISTLYTLNSSLSPYAMLMIKSLNDSKIKRLVTIIFETLRKFQGMSLFLLVSM